MTGASGASLSGALRVVICWQNLPEPEAHDVAAERPVRRVVDRARRSCRPSWVCIRRRRRAPRARGHGTRPHRRATKPSAHPRGGLAAASCVPWTHRRSKVAVLGAGAWGTALAKLLAEKGDDVALWSRRPRRVRRRQHRGPRTRVISPASRLPEEPRRPRTTSPARIGGAGMIVFVVPSHATREVARAAAPLVQAARACPS